MINPGDSGFVKVTFNPKNRKGKFHKSVYIYTNTKPNRIKLDISGIIIPTFNKIKRKKGYIDLQYNTISFGYVKDNEVKIDSFKIVNNDSLAVQIFFEKVPPSLSLDVKPKEILPNCKGYIIVKFNSNKKNTYGFFYDKIQMVILSNKIKSKKNIFFTATITPNSFDIKNNELSKAPIIYFPEKVKSLNLNKDSKEVNCEFPFQNKGKNNLIIYSVHINHGCKISDYSSVVKPGQTGYIKIVCDDVDSEKNYKKVVNVISNDPVNTYQNLRINYHF